MRRWGVVGGGVEKATSMRMPKWRKAGPRAAGDAVGLVLLRREGGHGGGHVSGRGEW